MDDAQSMNDASQNALLKTLEEPAPHSYIIMTTNRPDYLDPALIRPGRIDIKIHFKKASIKNIEDILVNFFKELKETNIPKVLEYKFPHSLISGICRESSCSKDVINKLIKLT